jgi:hypothetical protein
MCPACLVSAAVMAAGAGSTGGILAVCIGKLKKFFQGERSRPVSENQGEIKWQQAERAWTGKDNMG